MNLIAEIAQYWCETPTEDLGGGVPLTTRNVILTAMIRFPDAEVEDFVQAQRIADELLRADRAMQWDIDCANNPCACGEPGTIIVCGEDEQPTGERWCEACDLKDAAKVPCAKCGGPMDPWDVRGGETLCVACDPDEIGWEDDA